ncbi:MAG TPA: hypothetical protein VMG38_24085 [Trebonia sp.]|nr:hypothetical protein [Trebonia sp.]
MHLRKCLVVLALGGAGLLVASGCGTQVATASLTAAITRTTAQTARIAVTTTMQMQGMTVSVSASGAFDFTHSRGTLTMSSPVGLSEVFVPPRVYVKLPAGAGAPLPKGKTWIETDTGTGGDLTGAMLGGILTGPLPGGNLDPADLLASLTAISGSVTKQGTSTIRGVPVTKYRVNVDLAKAEAQVPSWERASFSQFAQGLGTGTIPVEVWVDGQNLVRQMREVQHLPGGAGAPAGAGQPGAVGQPAGTDVTQTIDFYDFGDPVQVSAPPAAEVASLPQAIGKGSFAGSASPGGPSDSSGPSDPGDAPPPVSGTLSPAQAAAAEQVVKAFWTALASNDPAAVAQTVPPSQRSCVRSMLSGGPTMTITSFRVTSARPAGNSRATVWFTVSAHGTLDGTTVPVLPPGSGSQDWLVTTKSAGHWYVDLAGPGDLAFSGGCD